MVSIRLNRFEKEKDTCSKVTVLGLPVGSTSREILIASDVARSWLAGEMARIIQLGCIESTANKTVQRLSNLALHNRWNGTG